MVSLRNRQSERAVRRARLITLAFVGMFLLSALAALGARGQSPAQNDAGSGADAPNDHRAPLNIVAGDHSGVLEPKDGDDADVYGINLIAGERLTVTLRPATGDFDLILLSPHNVYLNGSFYGGTTRDRASTIADENGTYRVVIDQFSGSGAYTFYVHVGTPDDEGDPIPDPKVPPYLTTHTFTGSIGCATALGPIQSGDPCRNVDRRHTSSFALPIDPGATAVRVVLTYNNTIPTDHGLLEYIWSMPVYLEGAGGPSPVVHTQTVPSEAPWMADGTQGLIHVRLARDQVLTAQQTFDLCVTVAYGGADIDAASCSAPDTQR